jgi:AcrR family transcriptional regulator
MTELNPRQKAAITKRNKTLDAFLSTAAPLYSDFSYPDIQVDDVVKRSGLSVPTFYNYFRAKSNWTAAVLDRRLNGALDQRVTTESTSPRTLLLGHLGLLGEVSGSLPGSTKALVDERADAQLPYREILPRYYGEVAQAVQSGQEQHAFRGDMTAAELADFAIDSIALAYAVHLDNPAARAASPSLVLDGLRAA